MKIEELLDYSAAELKALSDEQLLKYFEPYFNVTRPEFAPKPIKQSVNMQQKVVHTKQFTAKLEQLKEMGLDLSYLKDVPRKKK